MLNWYNLIKNIKISGINLLSYSLPTNPREIIADFYMSENFFADKATSEKIKDLIGYLQETIANQLKEKLQKDLVYIISAEFRHSKDSSKDNIIARELTDDENKFFRNYFIKFENLRDIVINNRIYNFNDAQNNSKIQDLNDENLNKFTSYLKDFRYENNSAQYNFSHFAVLETLKNTKTDTKEFVLLAKKIFLMPIWASQYGGKPWADICQAWLDLHSAKTNIKIRSAIDRIVDLQHNTGTLFNKLSSYTIENRYDWIKEFLDIKTKSTNPYTLLNFCSPKMKQIAPYILKDMGQSTKENYKSNEDKHLEKLGLDIVLNKIINYKNELDSHKDEYIKEDMKYIYLEKVFISVESLYKNNKNIFSKDSIKLIMNEAKQFGNVGKVLMNSFSGDRSGILATILENTGVEKEFIADLINSEIKENIEHYPVYILFPIIDKVKKYLTPESAQRILRYVVYKELYTVLFDRWDAKIFNNQKMNSLFTSLQSSMADFDYSKLTDVKDSLSASLYKLLFINLEDSTFILNFIKTFSNDVIKSIPSINTFINNATIYSDGKIDTFIKNIKNYLPDYFQILKERILMYIFEDDNISASNINLSLLFNNQNEINELLIKNEDFLINSVSNSNYPNDLLRLFKINFREIPNSIVFKIINNLLHINKITIENGTVYKVSPDSNNKLSVGAETLQTLFNELDDKEKLYLINANNTKSSQVQQQISNSILNTLLNNKFKFLKENPFFKSKLEYLNNNNYLYTQSVINGTLFFKNFSTNSTATLDSSTIIFRKNGQIHNENLPAVEWEDGTKFWFLNGKRHNENGPAVVHPDGRGDYFLDGEFLTKEEWEQKVSNKTTNINNTQNTTT